MEVGLRGRINNTKLGYSRCVAPLFETIVNSIHAIQQGGSKSGTIAILVERDTAGLFRKDWSSQPVTGFVVQDNGIGITDTKISLRLYIRVNSA